MKNKINIKIVIPTIFLIIISTYYSCQSPAGPDLTPGRRDYAWTVDTIHTQDNYYADLYSMWGSSPNDIWIAGPSYSYVNDAWHYDGTSWKPKPLASAGNITTIFGFAPNNVWAGCTNGDIFNFNGSEWKKNTTIVVDSLGPFFIENIWGNKSNDVYCVGYAGDTGGNYKGIIYHYDGTKWSNFQIDNIKTILLQIAISSSNNIVLRGWAIHEKQDTHRFYTLEGNTVKEIARTGENYNVTLMNNQFYITIGQKIYKYKNSLELWRDFSGTNYVGRLWGRTENDFFTVNNDGIGHYNGSDLITIYHSNYLYFNSSALFNSDVFFVRNTPDNQNLIIHGKVN